MTVDDATQRRIQTIVRKYIRGHELLWDAVCSIAAYLTSDTIDEIFPALPLEVQREMARAAHHLWKGGKWTRIDSTCPPNPSNSSRAGGPPFSEDVQRTLKGWFVKNEKQLSEIIPADPTC